jgi:hypothetical protein
MVKRYAEGTTVTVESSRGEITGILAKHGCDRMAWGTEPEGDTLQFVLKGKQFRFKIERPTAESLYKRWEADGDKTAHQLRYLPNDTQVAAEWRRRWRAHVLLIKAKLEFIEGGDTTLEQEFLPYAVMKDGRTVGELIAEGGLPLLTAGNGK